MIKNLLATVGFAVFVHYGYRHYLRYQRLKAENACLRERWKESVDKTVFKQCKHGTPT